MTKTIKELYVSVDVEADGPIPSDYSMTALGAVLAGYQTSEGEIFRLDVLAPENRFYAELKPISDLWVPESMKVGLFKGFGAEEAELDTTGQLRRDYIMEHGEDPTVVMDRYAEWVASAGLTHEAIPVFTAFPLGFDWMWNYWYSMKFSTLPAPFGHSRHLDIKTEYMMKSNSLITRSIKRNMPKRLRSQLPHTHLAVDDAAEQGELFMNILEWKGKPPKKEFRLD